MGAALALFPDTSDCGIDQSEAVRQVEAGKTRPTPSVCEYSAGIEVAVGYPKLFTATLGPLRDFFDKAAKIV